MSTQLPFDFALAPDYSARAFVTGACHAEAKADLEGWQNWPNNILALVGPKGCGKTHLGHIWAAQYDAVYGPKISTNIRPGTCVWLDDASQVNDQDLFRLINLALEGRIASLLLASRSLPTTWPYGFDDLHSRLKNIRTNQLKEPDDDLLRAIIIKLFKDRGLKVSANLISYLQSHAPRSVNDLRALIHQLDIQAANEKINVTRALAAKILQG